MPALLNTRRLKSRLQESKRLRPLVEAAIPVVNFYKKLTTANASGYVFPETDPAMEALLWGAHVSYAVGILEKQKRLGAPAKKRFQAGWGLARYYHSQAEFERAYENLMLAGEVSPGNANTMRFVVYRLELLRQMGKTEEAIDLSAKSLVQFGRDPDLLLMGASLLAAVPGSDERRLALLNEMYTNGIAPLRKIEASKPLSIHNITATAAADSRSDTGKISVIMPAFNCADFVETAVRGVLQQTWQNLELIVVDDASTDETPYRLAEIARTDARIKLVRHGENAGAYAARNTGLQNATGEFVTVNDSDDWSHPQKLSLQMTEVLDRPDLFSTTDGCKLLENLTAVAKSRTGRSFVQNTSSLLLRTEQARELGGWHASRFSADTEFYARVRQKTERKGRRPARYVPLTLILSREESLTRASNSGIQTTYYGARREYREAATYWREHGDTLRVNAGQPEFPIPQIARVRKGPPIETEFLVIGDMSTSTYEFAVLQALVRANKSAAILHLPTPETILKDFDNEIRRHIHENWLPVIVPGEVAKCVTAIIANPRTIIVLPDAPPELSAQRCLLLSDKDAMEPEILHSLRTLFGQTSAEVVNPKQAIAALNA